MHSERDHVAGGKSIQTEFIVQVSTEPRRVVVGFATLNGLRFVDKWRETLGSHPEPVQREAADLAQLAKERFIADSNVGQPYITDPLEIDQHVARDQQSEVAGFILLKCDWFPDSEIIGLCHFRRTWCNNIALDYLAIHPQNLVSSLDPQYKVKGIGSALLCFLSRIAVANSCGFIWGEATHISHGYYEKFFKLESVKDLFLIPRENFAECANLALDWQPTKDANTINLEAVKELHDAEEAHPPLVGNRTQMVGSKRRLIEHFLDLPRHTQDEVARTLGLLNEGDSSIPGDKWCGLLFQRAYQSGKLHELWNEVEKRHEDGEPEKNPFSP
ncbi:MAG: GNAT family N-acetyltransferase [Terriglobales bacterium]